MELRGVIKKIGDLQDFPSGFQKRELVIVTEEQYPQPISIEFLKEKGDLLNQLNEGDKVNVSINIGGREWTSPQGDVKYFNSITGWKIEKSEGSTPAEPSGKVKPATPHEAFGHEKKSFVQELEDDPDDLGF